MSAFSRSDAQAICSLGELQKFFKYLPLILNETLIDCCELHKLDQLAKQPFVWRVFSLLGQSCFLQTYIAAVLHADLKPSHWGVGGGIRKGGERKIGVGCI